MIEGAGICVRQLIGKRPEIIDVANTLSTWACVAAEALPVIGG